MNCKCWAETQEKLKMMNLKLVGATYLMPSFTLVPVIATEWLDANKAPKGQKRRPTAMLASHCPFCGTKITDPNAATAEAPNVPAEPSGTSDSKQSGA